MSITKSYNKNNGIYYAYDTRYEWDEVKQKRVQKKKCIGKYDPVTGKIIPNGKRGRQFTAPDLESAAKVQQEKKNLKYSSEVEKLAGRLRSVSDSYADLGRELTELTSDMNTLLSQMKSK